MQNQQKLMPMLNPWHTTLVIKIKKLQVCVL